MSLKNRLRNELYFDAVPGERRVLVPRRDAVVVAGVCEPETATVPLGTLVFVHGVASNASRWEEFVESTPLRGAWRLVRLDLRAHGASTSASPATLERHVEDMTALLDALGLEQAWFVGHSLGAQVAMNMASRHPERVTGMILLDPLIASALTPEAERLKRRRPWVALLERLGRLVNAMGLRRRLPHYSLREHDRLARRMLAEGGAAFERFKREYSSPLKDLGHMHLADYMRDLLEVGRPSPDLSDLDRPILLIASSAGSFTDPEALRRWTQTLKAGDYETLRCLHWPMTECPSEVGALMQTWLHQRGHAS